MMIEQYGCTVVSVIAPNLCKFINIHLRIPPQNTSPDDFPCIMLHSFSSSEAFRRE